MRIYWRERPKEKLVRGSNTIGQSQNLESETMEYSMGGIFIEYVFWENTLGKAIETGRMWQKTEIEISTVPATSYYTRRGK